MTIHFSADFKKEFFTFHGSFETKDYFKASDIPKYKDALIKKCKEVFDEKCLKWQLDPDDVIKLEIYYHTDKEETIYKWKKTYKKL